MDVKPVQRMQDSNKQRRSEIKESLSLGSFGSSAGPIHDWYMHGYFQFDFNFKSILQSQLRARHVPVGVLRVAGLLVREPQERPSQKPNTGTLLALQRLNIAKCMRWWEIVEHASLNCFTWGKFDRQVVGWQEVFGGGEEAWTINSLKKCAESA